MIQRIQSVYLLIAAILMAVVVCSPLALLVGTPDKLYMFKSMLIILEDSGPVQSTWGVVACAVVSALLSFIAIFLFKKRKIQIKLCYISIVFILLFYAAFGFYLNTAHTVFGAEISRVEYGLALPAIALVLTILALSKIKADERLVQSLNRIR